MSNQTSKPMSEKDFPQVLRGVYNDTDKSLTTSSFLTSQVGNKVTQVISTTNVSNDTATFSFYSNQTTLLYSLKVIYTDASQSVLLSAERTA